MPVETVIKARQEEYYQSLREADANSDCSVFIEFLLSAINESLTEAIQSEEKVTVKTSVKTSVKTPDQILAALAVNPELTLADVSVRIGKSLRAVECAVSKLKTEGRLEYQGPKKNGVWVVKNFDS